MASAIVDMNLNGAHSYGTAVSVFEDTIYAQIVTLGDSVLGYIGIELAQNYIRKSAYIYGPSASNAELVSITDMTSDYANASFTLIYWTE